MTRYIDVEMALLNSLADAIGLPKNLSIQAINLNVAAEEIVTATVRLSLDNDQVRRLGAIRESLNVQ